MTAQKLLLESDAAVAEVAERCGFSDVYHFSREFKRGTGASPAAWRRAEGKQAGTAISDGMTRRPMSAGRPGRAAGTRELTHGGSTQIYPSPAEPPI